MFQPEKTCRLTVSLFVFNKKGNFKKPDRGNEDKKSSEARF